MGTMDVDEMVARKKQVAPCPDGLPNSVYRCAEETDSEKYFRVHAGLPWNLLPPSPTKLRNQQIFCFFQNLQLLMIVAGLCAPSLSSMY